MRILAAADKRKGRKKKEVCRRVGRKEGRKEEEERPYSCKRKGGEDRETKMQRWREGRRERV